MSPRASARLAWGLWAAATAVLAGGWILGFVSEGLATGSNARRFEAFFAVFLPIFVLAFSTVGALVGARRPGNPIGWIFLGVALLWALAALGTGFAQYWAGRRSSIPEFVRVADWLGSWLFIPGIYIPVTFLLLLFPDGRVPSPRWKPVAWLSALGIAGAAVGSALSPGPLEEAVILRTNPYAVGGEEIWTVLESVLWGIGGVGMLGSVAALIVRFRRSKGEERLQLKWLAYGAVVVAVVFVLNGVGYGVAGDSDAANHFFQALTLLAITVVPVAAGVGILKYRLYDIDLVINKTLVYGALAAFITAVYVGVVVGIGSAFGRGDEPDLALSILATAAVAVAFQPVRARVQHWANRLVYGKRATPYEVLSEFSHRMAGTYAAGDLLPRMARILGEGTGAREAAVWLSVGRDLHPVARWPGGVGVLLTESLRVEVTHQGEALGALSIAKAPGEPLTAAEEKLTRDLASQAGLVLRNVRLIEDLKASRRRIVAAQDEERRRLERNIHDGAQQQLVALQVKLGLAKTFLRTDRGKADEHLAALQLEAQEALDDLRDLARGIYPPLLADRGLVAALQAQARKAPLPVEVEADGLGRYPQEVEAAVYFCVLEALQNVAKYAAASRAVVTLSDSAGVLSFTVTDDGGGFDPAVVQTGAGLQNMGDRLAALGGSLSLASRPGGGTTVSGSIPVATRQPAPTLERERVG